MWDYILGAAMVLAGLLLMDRADDARNWPTAAGWVVLAFLMIALGIVQAAA